MEIFNENTVLPALPARRGKKLALAHEVASRIVAHLDRNEPGNFFHMEVIVKHHGNKLAGGNVYVCDRGPDNSCCWRSGSKIVESVFEILSGVTHIESVTVRADILNPGIQNIGTFTL